MITQYHNKEPSGKWVLDSKNKKNSKTTQNLNTNQNLIFLYNITQSSSDGIFSSWSGSAGLS